MKKLILSLAVAGCLTIVASSCNSTKNMSGTTDSAAVDTTIKPVDTTKKMPVDTTKTLPDTIIKQ